MRDTITVSSVRCVTTSGTCSSGEYTAVLNFFVDPHVSGWKQEKFFVDKCCLYVQWNIVNMKHRLNTNHFEIPRH